MPPALLPILVFLSCAPAGKAVIRSHEMYGAVGSSVTFPPVNITEDTLYDFSKVAHTLMVTYHGIENIRPPYTNRVLFSSRTGEIELRNLTEKDSGMYEQVVNMTVVAVIHLHVIEPVDEPTLKKVNETIHGDQCRVLLECRVQKLGSVNVIFLKDGEKIAENITTIGRSRFCSVDAEDPGSHGSYTCSCLSPLGAKTSTEITVPTPDGICRKVTSNFWIIICIVIFIIIIIIIAVIIGIFIWVVLKGRTRGRNSRHNPTESELQNLNTTPPADGGRRREESSCIVSITDEGEPGESWDVAPEETSQPERITESSCNVSMTDEEEHGDDKTQDHDQELPPKEDSPNRPDLGQSGEESSCNASITDEEEHGDDKTQDHDQELPPKEDSPNCPDPGQCGEDEASTLDPELGRASSDHGQDTVD